MENVKPLNTSFAVAGQISEADVEALAAEGFRTLINNRPDGEVLGQPAGAAIEAAARRHGLTYHFLPVVSGQLTEAQVAQFRQLLEQVEGPVLAFCRSGTRSINLWALSQASRLSPDDILGLARDAGYDLEGLRPYLAAQWRDGDSSRER